MISCLPGTVLPLDLRVIESVTQRSTFRLSLDPDYLSALAGFHGGVPESPYLTSCGGDVRQIAWFVSYLDEDSTLSGPFEPAFYYMKNDLRVDDRSIPAIVNDEVCPYFGCERIIPFAALITDGSMPLTLRLYTLDSYPADSLCFETSTRPHTVVICDGQRAAEEAVRFDDGDIEDVDYTVFTQPVANSFLDFTKMLRHDP
ncbi:MAG: hypothetical protein NXI29_03965 [bacterium]|nr:hypothetical protein [bacterium]